VHPYFKPRDGYEIGEPYIPLKDGGLNFIHDNHRDFIMTANDQDSRINMKKLWDVAHLRSYLMALFGREKKWSKGIQVIMC